MGVLAGPTPSPVLPGAAGPCTLGRAAGRRTRGMNLHAATTADGRDRKQLERICRYLLRPPSPTTPSRRSPAAAYASRSRPLGAAAPPTPTWTPTSSSPASALWSRRPASTGRAITACSPATITCASASSPGPPHRRRHSSRWTSPAPTTRLLRLAREFGEAFVPCVPGTTTALESRRIKPDADTLRRLAELLTPPEDVEPGAWLDRQVELVSGYVRDYATICAADPEQAHHWGGHMLETRLLKGQASAWETTTRIVDPVARGPGRRPPGRTSERRTRPCRGGPGRRRPPRRARARGPRRRDSRSPGHPRAARAAGARPCPRPRRRPGRAGGRPRRRAPGVPGRGHRRRRGQQGARRARPVASR